MWKREFLDKLKVIGIIERTCKAARVHPDKIYKARREDPEFAREFDAIRARLTEQAEDEVYRRGKKGWREPIIYKGERVGWLRRYSDTCLLAYLKANNPAKWRESYQARDSGPGDVGLPPELAKEFMAFIASKLDRARQLPDIRPDRLVNGDGA